MWLLYSMASYIWIRRGCCKQLIMSISRSISARSFFFLHGTIFAANSKPVFFSRHKKTVPKLPRPSSGNISQRLDGSTLVCSLTFMFGNGGSMSETRKQMLRQQNRQQNIFIGNKWEKYQVFFFLENQSMVLSIHGFDCFVIFCWLKTVTNP